MNYCTERDDLPIIPPDLILPIDTIVTHKNVFKFLDYAHTYASYLPNKDLVEYIESLFGKRMVVRYQVINNKLKIHTDFNNVDMKLNYMIDPGGDDIATRWWDSLEGNKIVHEVVCEPNKWYNLNIRAPHDVTRVTRPRISITVKEET